MKSLTCIFTAVLSLIPFTYANSQTVTAKFINGIPQADQFPGAPDACTQINMAAAYAIANHIDQVDATHFIPSSTAPYTVQCSTNPFYGLNPTIGAPLNLTINFGAVVFASAVPWVITNSSIALHGEGNTQTVVELTGTGSNVLYAHAQSSMVHNGLEEVDIRNMMFVGNQSNVTDAVLLVDVNRSNFFNVSAWGASNCGIHTEGAVTDSFYRPTVSQREYLNVFPSGSATTANGLCFDSSPVSDVQTTNGTVTDASVEYVTNIGWHVISAQTMTFTSGTSEYNFQGINVSSVNSKFNTFIDSDIEGNSMNSAGVDVYDVGNLNTYINLLATSACGGCSSVLLTGTEGQQFLLGGYQPTGASGPGLNGISPIGYSTTSATAGSASPLPSTPAGYWVIELLGNIIKIPYYH